MDNSTKEILPLTSVRFITALYVFLFHLQIYWHIGKPGSWAGFLAKGSCGMSTFFILSGFVLGYRFNQGITNIKKYAFQRFSRIYPVYFVAALVTLPWLFISLAPYESHFLGLRTIFVVFSNIFMLQAWMPQLFSFWNDGGSWSLSVEMFFYALFPFLVNYFKSLSNKNLYQLLFFSYLFSALPGLSGLLFNQNDTITFYSVPIYRVSEFTIGLICGLLFARGLRIHKPEFSTVLSTALLTVYLLKGPDLHFIIMAHNYATVPLIALVLFSVASLSSGWLYQFMSNRLFVYFGRISYSFYSFQVLLLLILIPKHDALVSMFPSMANPYSFSLSMFAVLIAVASVSYHLLENKFRIYLQTKFAKYIEKPSRSDPFIVPLSQV